MDIDKAFSVDNGFTVDEENSGPFYSGGVVSPIGLGLPFNTVYMQTVAGGALLWQKFGAGDTASDWRLYPAEGVSYDVTTLLATSPDLAGLTNTKEVVDQLSSRVFGGQYGYLNFSNNFSTTSNTFETALTLSLGSVPRGRYHMQWSYQTLNSKSNTNNETQISFNDAEVVNNTLEGTGGVLGNNAGTSAAKLESGFYSFAILATTLDIKIKIITWENALHSSL